mgnify:CR=1 FL=1
MNLMKPRDDYERQIIDCVDKHGCFVASILGDEEVDLPPFTYSVGFTRSLGQPEAIICGLPIETGPVLINDLFALCRDGLDLDDGTPIDNLVSGFSCVARTVDESWLIQSWFASALWYHRNIDGKSLRHAVQIVWPDPQHLFPWDEGCAEWVRRDQPALYEPRLIS